MRRLIGGVVGVTVVTLLAACGSSAAPGGSSSGGSDVNRRYQGDLASLYKGTFKLPSGPTVKAPTGKKIWYIMYSGSVGTVTSSADAAKEAAAKLGWSVNAYDGKFDPNAMLTGVQQAIAAKADGIVMYGIDCSMVQTGLAQAKAAGIPVVGIESQDCDPSLEYVVSYADHERYLDFIRGFAQAQATWVIAKTNGQAKVIMNSETDTATTLAGSAAQKAEFAKCSGCQVVDDVKWVGADAGPALQAKIQQALIAHPDANSFVPTYDAVMTQYGGAQALAASGRLSKLVVAGGEGSVAGMAQIRNGTGMQMSVGEDTQAEAYAGMDALVRLFLHEDPTAVDTGIGIQIVDKDHNLPSAGSGFTAPVDYRDAYYKLWGLG